jgi:hypothetical protein
VSELFDCDHEEARKRIADDALLTVSIADRPPASFSMPFISLMGMSPRQAMFEKRYRSVANRLFQATDENVLLPFCACSTVNIDQMNACTVTCLWIPSEHPGLLEGILRDQLGDDMDWPTELCSSEDQEQMAGKMLSLGFKTVSSSKSSRSFFSRPLMSF